jgi:predicted permease
MPVFSKDTLKNLINPPLIAFFGSILLVLLGLPLPGAVLKAAEYLGAIVTPLSTVFIGTVLAGIALKDIRIDRGQIAVVVVRFLLSPGIVYLLAMLIPIGQVTRDAFLVQASMPVMTQVSIIAAMYGADAQYATVGTTLTTVLSLGMLPLLAAILPYI